MNAKKQMKRLGLTVVILILVIQSTACDALGEVLLSEFVPQNSITQAEQSSVRSSGTSIETSGQWSNPEVRVVEVEVSKVSDGDTIRATVDGKNQRVRLIGIDSPELAHPDDGIEEEYSGAEAFAYTKEMLEGETVYLSFDEEMYDQYDRILAYLWINDPRGYEEDYAFAKEYQFNCLLLEQGYAKFVRIPPNLTFASIHKALADDAKAEKAGLWAEP